MAKRPFGVSTHLYRQRPLSRAHLLEIAAHGFETVELFATRTHFDFHSAAAIGDLQQWLGEAGLSLHAIHAPVGEGNRAGGWTGALSLASADPAARARALGEAEQALYIARRIPASVFVAHIGLPRWQRPSPAGPTETRAADTRDGARRSVEALAGVAAPLGVRVAVEVIQNELSRAGSLAHFIEADLEQDGVGICLDFGHAHLDGDLNDAIEIVSEHLAAVHVHDNRGHADDHLLPFEGTIDWPAALTGIQKVGYEGPLMLEIEGRGPSKQTLQHAKRARKRMERLLAH
ncbi:MAG: sugar phosphate isomerase/epimerase [Acidobacteria bacterium]|nr:sugar phosphate isomerase/epimerase [Acidobacteriota bacterium]